MSGVVADMEQSICFLIIFLFLLSGWVYGSGITVNATGGGSPGSPTGSVQYNSTGSFAGSSNFQFNGTSVTVASSVTVRTPTYDGASDNSSPGYLNVYVGNTQNDDNRVLFAVGSNQALNQLYVVNNRPPYFGIYGITAGELRLGYSGYTNQIGAANSANNAINFWSSEGTNSNGVSLKTGAASGRDITFMPQETETVHISSNAVAVNIGGSANQVMCWKSDGKTLGYCSSVVGIGGACTCN